MTILGLRFKFKVDCSQRLYTSWIESSVSHDFYVGKAKWHLSTRFKEHRTLLNYPLWYQTWLRQDMM